MSDSMAGELEALLRNEALAVAVPLARGLKVTVSEALWPAASVKGNDSPETANSGVVTVAEETVTLEPVALSDAVRLALCPTTTLPKFKLEGETVNWPAAVPVPANEIASVEFEALDTTEMLPLALPAEMGANTAPKVKLCPGIRVRGRVSPLMLNPEPLALACVIVTLDPPELVKVSVRLVLLPTCTLPKLRLEGFDVSEPDATPAARRATLRLGSVASLVMATLPVAAPVDCAENTTLKFLL